MLLRLLAVVAISLAGLAHAEHHAHAHATPIPVDRLVEQIESAHRTDRYLSQSAVQADIVVNFGDQTLVDGTMWFTPAVGKSRLELEDGTTVVFDGQTCWVTPESAADPMKRFHALTWPYFVALPHKLTEPGVNLETVGRLPSAGQKSPAVKMTFDAGVGDAPDDWFYVFPDTQGVVRAASYIVTYSKPQEQAEQQPSIVLYDGYERVDGVPISTRWTFGYWDKSSGMTTAKGTAELSDVAFVTPPADAFRKPAGAVEVSAP